MRTEIIPTILVKTFKEVKDRIKAVEKYVNWIQLDIMDGIFVENKTWNNPKDLKNFKPKVRLEAHLMVNKPEKVIGDWLEAADRIIPHFEACVNLKELIKKVHKKRKEIGVALNPETHPSVLEPFLKDLDLVLLMSVQPGRGGQEFKEWVLEKAKFLKERKFKGNIEIDGGINDKNIKKVIKSGINLICVGTYIFENKNINPSPLDKGDRVKKTIENLKQLI